MKKISILFSTLLIAGGAFAQSKTGVNPDQESGKTHASAHEIRMSNTQGAENLVMPKGERGDQFFCEDFANGFDGNNPIGAWTFEDSGNDNIWMVADGNSPAGEFSSNLNGIASPTAANGWVIFDCDLFNTPISDGVEDVTGFLYAPEMDMSGMNSVIVDYYQYFRYCCFSASPLTVEVSTNGGTDWTAFPAHGTFVPSANSLSANPLYTKVDISCAAAGEESVLIRWAYNSAVATGYSHYFWGLDDICIYENPVVNDLEVRQVTNGDIYNIWEYRITPLDQAITAANGGLLALVIYRNNGTSDQTNVEITIEILDDAMSVLSTTVTDPFEMPAFANTPECPSFLLDTLFIDTNWEPTSLGTYYVRASIAADATDETPADNTLDREIEYTSDEYGHDGPMDFDLEVGALVNDDDPDLFDRTGYGSFYTCPNEGSTAHGITVVFGENSDNGTEFAAGLAEVVEFLDDGDFINAGYYNYNEEWFTGDPYYLPYDDSYELATDQVYFAAIFTETETEGNLTVLANDETDNDNSTAVINLNGDGEPTWFSSQNWTPGIRLILSERVGVNEIDVTTGLDSFQVNPNPASSVANLNFDLNTTVVVAYEVRDMTGKLIEFKNLGRFVEGNNNVQINVSNYAAGNYNVSLVLGGQHFVTRQMSVIK
jgi:hypothetical protein